MLKLTYKKDNDRSKPFSDIEKIFAQTEIKDTKLVREVIKQIENGEYINNTKFKDKFGYDLEMECLSTGCKAAIILVLGYTEQLDLTECGYNARDVIMSKCRNGSIVLNSTYLFSWDEDEGDRCEVEFNGYKFTRLSRLNYYLDEEWDSELHYNTVPDLDRPGIEKL